MSVTEVSYRSPIIFSKKVGGKHISKARFAPATRRVVAWRFALNPMENLLIISTNRP